MTFDIFKLYFQTPLHLSRGKLNTYADSDSVLHSDMLKSAMYATALELYGEAVASKAFFDSFLTSSAFPFVSSEYFFPKPLNLFLSGTVAQKKELKKTTHLPAALFARVLRNDKINIAEVLDESGKAKNPVVFKRFMTQRVNIYEDDIVDANTGHETGETTFRSTPFYIDKLYPENGNTRGLYFIVQQPGKERMEKEMLQQLTGILRLLGDNGLGLQRKLGNGQFRCEHAELELALPENANAILSLSTYRPTEDELNELDWEAGFYQFIQRGGWISSPANEEQLSIRKKSMYVFSEGSVFTSEGGVKRPDLKGKVEDLKPDNNVLAPDKQVGHPVWRDGRIVALPINI